MNSDPLVSIVLPTYNGSRYLEQSLQSIVNQTYSNWELILVDDASTDTTPELIAQWVKMDLRIRAVRNDRNRRLPGSLNHGFTFARGQFLTWTSDDNRYRPDALEKMLQCLRAHPAVGMVYASSSDIDEHGAIVREVVAEEPPLLTEKNVVRACFLYRSEVRQKVGDYDENFCLVEDWDYWIRIARHYPLMNLRQNLYEYRWHPNSLTTTKQQQVRLAVIQLLDKHLPDMNWAGSRAVAEGYFFLAAFSKSLGDYPNMMRFLKAAFRHDPLLSVKSTIAHFGSSVLRPTS
jgi:glycosyltransferase involved in cell wall biosynthesis